MFDPEKLKIGDVFYSIKERNQAFHRDKIHKEIDGQDWFRYTTPLRTYEIVEYKVLGILRPQLEGRWKHGDPDWDLETEFFVQTVDEIHFRTLTTFLDGEEQYYMTREEAQEQIKIFEAEAREMDMK